MMKRYHILLLLCKLEVSVLLIVCIVECVTATCFCNVNFTVYDTELCERCKNQLKKKALFLAHVLVYSLCLQLSNHNHRAILYLTTGKC